ncbi:MAG: mechanosensitive ion channel [Clostridia bacterium]|nr:mechanosensitive ion channel [Clostridia bacterium]
MDKINKKEIAVFTVMTLLLLAASLILFRAENGVILDWEQTDDRMKLDSICEVIGFAEAMREHSGASYERHLQQKIRLMTEALSLDVTEEGYAGPRLFSDGAVVVIRDGKAAWPEGIPADFPELNVSDVLAGEPMEAVVPAGGAQDADAAKRVIFHFGRIADNCFYVNWSQADEILNDRYALIKDGAFMEAAEGSVDGSLILVSSKDRSLPLICGSGGYPDVRSALDLGFTPEIIAEHRTYVDVNGERSLCTYADIDRGDVTLIYVRTLRSVHSRAVLHVGMAMVSSLIILVAVTHYIFAVRRYVRKNSLSVTLAGRYRPNGFRRIILMAGLTGAVVIFLLTAVFQTMDTLHVRSVAGARSMSRLLGYLQSVVVERTDDGRKQEADWNVSLGEDIAALIARHPEEGKSENLRKYCDILDIDFIMLFDRNGREISSNADYSGLTMDEGLGEDSSDFRRLLLGVPSIVHDVSTDPTTGLTRQMIGVTMPLEPDHGRVKHGALVMAIVPGQENTEPDEIRRLLLSLSEGGAICLFTDKETGEILYSSEDSLNGMTVLGIGLTENSLQDGYTDFADIRGKNHYVTMYSQENVNFYYIFASDQLFGNTLPAAGSVTAVYLAVFIICFLISLRGYPAEYAEAAVETGTDIHGQNEGPVDAGRGYSELVVSRKRYENRWADRTPEKQANFILQIDVLILVLVPALFFLGGYDGDFDSGSLLRFILYGDWMRGLNMFAVCSVVIVFALGSLAIVVCNVLLSMIAGFCGKGGDTVCRMIYSFCRYVVAITVIYYIFEYIGLSLSAYFASMGTVSLAVSLGSKDMIADIFAGIMILFEHQFQVGDSVDLDGCKGVVLEMGVRSTKLLTTDNDIRFISNSKIRSVLNKSRVLSTCRAEFTVVTGEPLEKVEGRFDEALSEIGKKNGKIVGGLRLEGISRVSGGGRPDRDKIVSVRVKCSCRELDYEDVRNFINREVYLFCERANIEVK